MKERRLRREKIIMNYNNELEEFGLYILRAQILTVAILLELKFRAFA